VYAKRLGLSRIGICLATDCVLGAAGFADNPS